MRKFVLGIDPGDTTGLALIRFEDGESVLEEGVACLLEDLPGHDIWSNPIHKVVIEGWEYQGPKKSRAVPQVAQRYGYCLAAAHHHACAVVTVTRSEVIRALFGKRTRMQRKDQMFAWTARLLTGIPLPAPPDGYHVADGAAAALAGSWMAAKTRQGEICA